MLNRTILVGRLTRDPELRTTQSGVNVASFTLAVNRTFTNAQGEREAELINIIVFKKQAENVNKYLSKGWIAHVVAGAEKRGTMKIRKVNVYTLRKLLLIVFNF